jgi:transposase InsO family protein
MKGSLRDNGTYSITYNLPYWFTRRIRRYTSLMDISPQAQTRLSMLEFYYQIKDAAATARLFKTSRKSLYKWRRRYETSGKQLSSLDDQSTAPISRRHSTLSFADEMKIKKLREKYIRLGKRKLQSLYRKEHGEYMSCHHIQQVIEKYELYFDRVRAQKIKYKKDKRRGARKVRINEINPNDYVCVSKPFFFCCDSIVLYLPYGIKRYILTAVERERKIAYARVYPGHSSLYAFDFLMRLNLLVEGKIAAILSDNGSEFARFFDEACRKLNIVHIYSRVKTPKDNPIVERFNRTLQEEFMETSSEFEPSLVNSTLIKTNRLLTEWLIFYNFTRPHQSLDYLTPIEYYQSQLQVSPIYPSLTLA